MNVTAALLLSLIVVGCVPDAPPDYKDVTFDTTELIEASSLGKDDVFDVRVSGHDDLSGTHRVSPEGDIDFPLIGKLKVLGLNSSQIADVIRAKLMDGYLRNPSVAVFVKEYNSKKVFVLGQVAKPGAFIYDESMSVVQAIALSGGFTAFARQNYVIVTRKEAGVEKRIPVPVEQIMTDPLATNFLLKPGDIVFVPEAPL